MPKIKLETFIDKARKIHGDKYDYSKVDYKGTEIPVCIICPKHGEFWQRPHYHLSGCGCKKCFEEKRGSSQRLTKEQFIEKARKIHGNKYDYSKVEYKNTSTKVCIICPKHGEFWQTPANHLNYGCNKCGYDAAKIKMKDTTEVFIEKARKIHGNKYDYSKVNYVDAHTPVCIICPEHGEFWQSPTKHLNTLGCPKCNATYLEHETDLALTNKNINFIYQCTSKKLKWLGFLSLDFYLPDYKIAIECQGEQHYCPIDQFGGEKSFRQQQKRDFKKMRLCKAYGIKLIYFTHYDKISENENIYKDKDKLIEYILKNGKKTIT